ncbi:MAG: hypothetical protein GXP37_15655 [Chloroflexi bacterium]|nr:hypothetical protein [Chloroflexota bacterium]
MIKEQPTTQTAAQQTVLEDQRQQPQPWRPPTLKRLRLSLDTAYKTGSNTDAGASGNVTD